MTSDEDGNLIIWKSPTSRKALARYLYTLAVKIGVAADNLRYAWARPGDFPEYPLTEQPGRVRRRRFLEVQKDGSLTLRDDTWLLRSIHSPGETPDGLGLLEMPNIYFDAEAADIRGTLREYEFVDAILAILYDPVRRNACAIRVGMQAPGLWYLERLPNAARRGARAVRAGKLD